MARNHNTDIEIRNIDGSLANLITYCAKKEGITVSRFIKRLINEIVEDTPARTCEPCKDIYITGVHNKEELNQVAATYSVDISALLKIKLTEKYLFPELKKKSA